MSASRSFRHPELCRSAQLDADDRQFLFPGRPGRAPARPAPRLRRRSRVIPKRRISHRPDGAGQRAEFPRDRRHGEQGRRPRRQSRQLGLHPADDGAGPHLSPENGQRPVPGERDLRLGCGCRTHPRGAIGDHRTHARAAQHPLPGRRRLQHHQPERPDRCLRRHSRRADDLPGGPPPSACWSAASAS